MIQTCPGHPCLVGPKTGEKNTLQQRSNNFQNKHRYSQPTCQFLGIYFLLIKVRELHEGFT